MPRWAEEIYRITDLQIARPAGAEGILSNAALQIERPAGAEGVYRIADLQIERHAGAEEIYRTDEHFELIDQIERQIVEANEKHAQICGGRSKTTKIS